MYLTVFGGIITSYLITIRYKKYRKVLYLIWFTVLWVMLCVRYGQGSDYFSYNYIVQSVPTIKDAIFNPQNVHGELGFRILCSLFGGNFKLFVVVVSTFEMMMLNKFIKIYSSNPVLTLMLFYPTIYLSYYFSMIRQGIALAIFMGILIPCFHQRKWIKYYMTVIVAITIHSVSAVLLIVPIVRLLKLKHLFVFLVPSSVLGVFLSTNLGQSIVARIPLIGYYASDVGISLMGVLERLIMLFGTVVLFLFYKKRDKNDEVCDWIKINTLGMCLYMIFLPYALISARVMAAFKLLEIVIYPRLLEERKWIKQFAAIGLVVITSVMTCKNLQSYIEQGNYHENMKFYEYPYISIFNENEIWDYRSVPPHYKLLE